MTTKELQNIVINNKLKIKECKDEQKELKLFII